jgi:DivIVA domain-containing protein
MNSDDIQNARFRSPKKSGLYVASDVDDFLEQVAGALDQLHAELDEARKAAKSAEESAKKSTDQPTAKRVSVDEVASSDVDAVAELSRTLLLAQRAADIAREEAQADADKLRSEAQETADRIRTDARKDADALVAETQGALRAEVARLEASRAALQDDIDGLQVYIDNERQRLRTGLAEMLGALESGIPTLSPRPTVHEIDAPTTNDRGLKGDGGSRVQKGSGGSGRSGAAEASDGSSNSRDTSSSVVPARSVSSAVTPTYNDRSGSDPIKVNIADTKASAGAAGAVSSVATAQTLDSVWIDEADLSVEDEVLSVDTPTRSAMAVTAKQNAAPVVDVDGESSNETPSMQMYLSDLRSLNDDDEAANDPTGEVFMRSPEEEERRLRQMTSNKRFARRKRGS